MDCALITTLNEEGTIGALVIELKRLDLHVLIVDDHSTDNTVGIARKYGAVIISPPSNERSGIGPCLLHGYQFVLRSFKSTHVLQLDAGGSHDPHDAPRLLYAATYGNAAQGVDVVIGSRFISGGYHNGNTKRSVLSRAAALACSVRFGLSLHDWTSGYRVFSRQALKQLCKHRYTYTMHAWQIETLAKIYNTDLTIAEVPIAYHAGRSSLGMRGLMDALQLLRRGVR